MFQSHNEPSRPARCARRLRVRAPRLRSFVRQAQPGYAAVDAMVAMLILALTVVLTLRAVQQAEASARLAQEFRDARSLMAALMLDGPRSLTPAAGNSAGFAWTLETQATGAERPVELCRRAVELRSETTARRFFAVSAEPCPLAAS